MTASTISRCLPPEIIEKILAEAWSQCATTNERWDLYKALSAAHPSMHELLVTVAARHPCFMCNASRRDILLYRETTDLAASFARARGGTESNGPASPPAEHIRIDITLLALTGKHDTGGLAAAMWRGRWEEYVSDLQAVVPECSSITLLSRRLHDAHAAVCLRSLPSFPFLKRLYLNFTLHTVNFEPLMPISSVLFLRIKKLPACKCRYLDQFHNSNCLTPRFLRAFPNLQHLHLDQPSFLKFLESPHSLHTITLEAPPSPPFSSLLEYNITSALRRGFLQWPGRKHAVAPPTIVVHTGLAEPVGFGQAQLACTQYDVALRREIVYME
ncbi:hypothetical protein OH76DRAFT_1421457 [Lentinus brumalis]|uniref:F-box domain-containing protein n=1 Tax=Lentinus brumalis TaxID=2498619 RepID=A0A371CVE6_9APHY|nr:hypothetical protein OH76DRAFT_1421457 [Polyporus brumalis]